MVETINNSNPDLYPQGEMPQEIKAPDWSQSEVKTIEPDMDLPEAPASLVGDSGMIEKDETLPVASPDLIGDSKNPYDVPEVVSNQNDDKVKDETLPVASPDLIGDAQAPYEIKEELPAINIHSVGNDMLTDMPSVASDKEKPNTDGAFWENNQDQGERPAA